MSEFILDIDHIRRSARIQMENGAVTPNYQADRDAILKLLDSALASEWLCVLRYTQHSKAVQGIHAEPIARHFAIHARQEQEHADALTTRIKQLGGNPGLDPSTFADRGHTEYRECASVVEMIRENLIAERIAIDAYSVSIRFIGANDPTTRRVLEDILAVEEEHADELADLMKVYDTRSSLS